MTANIDDMIPLAPLTLILGGARSGKSVFAERCVEAVGGGIYLATAEAQDEEMRERVLLHRKRRGDLWRTLEEPVDLAAALKEGAELKRGPLLIDCLTLWLSNIMAANKNVGDETEALISTLNEINAPVVMVSNEVGLGIVPDNALARVFRDEAGRVNQRLAEVADRVIFVAAGLPIRMKG